MWCSQFSVCSGQGVVGPLGMSGREGPWGALGENGKRGPNGEKGHIGLMVSVLPKSFTLRFG